jgi:phage-related minor tail protein
MAGDSRLSARFSSDTTDFKNGLAEINRELRVVESGFKASSSALGDWSNSATGLEQRISSLNK